MKYVVRTWVEAESAAEAIEKAKTTAPQEVFVDQKQWDENKLGGETPEVSGFDTVADAKKKR